MDDAGEAEVRAGERRRRPDAWATQHPLVVVLVLAGIVAVGQAIWIWTHRHLGAIDPDEAGYVATAFRYHRVLSTEPLALPRAVGGTGFGPLVPLLSVPLLWVGPDDVRTVFMVLPILQVVMAVAVAGIARRLSGPWAAIAAGSLLATFPTVIFATQTYWFGLGAAASLACAVWALVASDRLTNRRAYAFGAAVAAMLLSRTMSLGYVPAAYAAAVVLAGRQRSSWVGLAKALATTAVLAGPWYLVARHAIFGYLFSYGYGERAGLFGHGGPGRRLLTRLDRIHEGVGIAYPVGLALLVAAAAVLAWQRWHGRPWPETTRPFAAVTVAVLTSLAVLTSTSNNGVWFELPLVAILVALVASAAASLPWPVVAVAVVPVTAAGVLQLACAWWFIAPGPDPVPLVAQGQRSSQYEFGFGEYDQRFLPTHRDELETAAREWWELSSSVERRLHAITGGGPATVTVSGNFEMFNSNTLSLAGELRGWTVRARVPDTVTDRAGRQADLTPTFAGGPKGRVVERILVIALHRQHLFTPDVRVRELYREARRSGWRIVGREPIPGGGRVLVLRHPDGERSRTGR